MADWTLDAPQISKFTALFTDLAAQAGHVPSLDKASAGLNRAGLPVDVLLQIWALADLDGDDRLSLAEYLICAFLISRCLRLGEAPPAQLPPELIGSALVVEDGAWTIDAAAADN